jgi:hypothetical protein
MLHPDQYAFVASVSGVYETLSEPRLRAIWEALGYMRDQGYGTGATDEIWWRNYDPSQIATNLAGFGGKLLLSYGDACLSAASLATDDCRTYSPVRNPAAATIEALLVGNNHVAVKDLPGKAIPAQFVQLPACTAPTITACMPTTSSRRLTTCSVASLSIRAASPIARSSPTSQCGVMTCQLSDRTTSSSPSVRHAPTAARSR